MWAIEHAMVDRQRFNYIKVAYKEAYRSQQLHGVARWAQLTPPWIAETGYGAARIGLAFGSDRGNRGRFTWMPGLSLSPQPFLDLPDNMLGDRDAASEPLFDPDGSVGTP